MTLRVTPPALVRRWPGLESRITIAARLSPWTSTFAAPMPSMYIIIPSSEKLIIQY